LRTAKNIFFFRINVWQFEVKVNCQHWGDGGETAIQSHAVTRPPIARLALPPSPPDDHGSGQTNMA
jgi:hypothetical protein